jgi:hypothetical protein
MLFIFRSLDGWDGANKSSGDKSFACDRKALLVLLRGEEPYSRRNLAHGASRGDPKPVPQSCGLISDSPVKQRRSVTLPGLRGEVASILRSNKARLAEIPVARGLRCALSPTSARKRRRGETGSIVYRHSFAISPRVSREFFHRRFAL